MTRTARSAPCLARNPVSRTWPELPAERAVAAVAALELTAAVAHDAVAAASAAVAARGPRRTGAHAVLAHLATEIVERAAELHDLAVRYRAAIAWRRALDAAPDDDALF